MNDMAERKLTQEGRWSEGLVKAIIIIALNIIHPATVSSYPLN